MRTMVVSALLAGIGVLAGVPAYGAGTGRTEYLTRPASGLIQNSPGVSGWWSRGPGAQASVQSSSNRSTFIQEHGWQQFSYSSTASRRFFGFWYLHASRSGGGYSWRRRPYYYQSSGYAWARMQPYYYQNGRAYLLPALFRDYGSGWHYMDHTVTTNLFSAWATAQNNYSSNNYSSNGSAYSYVSTNGGLGGPSH